MADELINQKKPSSIVLHMGLGESINLLSDENAGKVFKAIFEYANSGESPLFQDVSLNIVFIQARQAIDENFKKYANRCETNRQNISKRYEHTPPNTNVHDGTQSNTNATNKIKENKSKENK